MKSKTTRKNSKKNVRRSMKGKWGKVGAPPKTTKFPKTPFTIAALKKRNTNQCELSLRNKVDAMLDDGSLIPITPKKQANGGVGRPAPRYILKENFDASKHEKAERPVKTGKRPATVTANVSTQVVPTVAPTVTEQPEVVAAVPAPAPVVEVTAPVVPEVVAPVEQPANVIPAPTETPAPEQQAA